MKTMSSKEIKDHYGRFTETARRELVVHTSHGRPTLVTLSMERAKAIPELEAELSGEEPRKKTNALLDALGKGAHLSAYRDEEDVVETLRRMRDEWR